MKQLLADAINRMPERERLVLTLYYYEGLTLSEIGEVLGVTESRVCQIHTKAILQLRARLVEPERRPGAVSRDFPFHCHSRPVRSRRHVELRSVTTSSALPRAVSCSTHGSSMRLQPSAPGGEPSVSPSALPLRRFSSVATRSGAAAPAAAGAGRAAARGCRPSTVPSSGRSRRRRSRTAPATGASTSPRLRGLRCGPPATAWSSFAGSVAGSLHVVVAHDGEPPYDVRVPRRRQRARRATASLAARSSASSAAPAPSTRPAALHFGVRLGDRYVDPQRLFGVCDLTQLVRLVPVDELPAEPWDARRVRLRVAVVGRGRRRSRRRRSRRRARAVLPARRTRSFRSGWDAISGGGRRGDGRRGRRGRVRCRRRPRRSRAGGRRVRTLAGRDLSSSVAIGPRRRPRRLVASPRRSAPTTVPPPTAAADRVTCSWPWVASTPPGAPDDPTFAARHARARLSARRGHVLLVRARRRRVPADADARRPACSRLPARRAAQAVPARASRPRGRPHRALAGRGRRRRLPAGLLRRRQSRLPAHRDGRHAVVAAPGRPARDRGRTTGGKVRWARSSSKRRSERLPVRAGVGAVGPSARRGLTFLHDLWDDRLPEHVDFTTIGATDDVLVPATQVDVPDATQGRRRRRRRTARRPHEHPARPRRPPRRCAPRSRVGHRRASASSRGCAASWCRR